jgi:7-cyano-7-deazaguanine synthase
MSAPKTVVLLSGGMDSVTALYWAIQQHTINAVLSFHYGAKHNDKEIAQAKWHSNQLGIRHEIIALPFVDQLFSSSLLQSGESIPDGHYTDESMRSTVVPFRNAIMLSIACGFAESIQAQSIVIAAHSGDHAIYPDCREPFMQAMATAMQQGTYANITLKRPFIDMDKAAITKLGQTLNVPYEHTWSCYKGQTYHCGTCGTCVERIEAFKLAGIPDPTIYSTAP